MAQTKNKKEDIQIRTLRALYKDIDHLWGPYWKVGSHRGKYGIYSEETGKLILSEAYDDVSYLTSCGKYVLFSVQEGKLFGAFSTKEMKFVVGIVCDNLEWYSKNFCWLEKDNKQGTFEPRTNKIKLDTSLSNGEIIEKVLPV